jgi:formylglycine-generating enzyme required for sulfatase activity
MVTQIAPQDGMVLIYIPAGEFKMGSTRTEDTQILEEELPQHTVHLDDYWIDQTEVMKKRSTQKESLPSLCVA